MEEWFRWGRWTVEECLITMRLDAVHGSEPDRHSTIVSSWAVQASSDASRSSVHGSLDPETHIVSMV